MVERIDKSRIAFITNEQGGHNKRKSHKEFDDVVASIDAPHKKITNEDDALQALISLSSLKPKTIFINGGDGSVDMIIRHIRNNNIFGVEPSLVLLKGGTTNLIHRDVGLKGTPIKAVKKIIKNDFKNLKKMTRKPLKITAHQNESNPLYGFFLATGAVPRIILQTRNTLHVKKLTGKFGEFLVLAQTLIQLYLNKNLDNHIVLKPSLLIKNSITENHIFMAITSLKKLIPFVKSPAADDKIGMLYMKDDRRLLKETFEDILLETKEDWVLDGQMHPRGVLKVNMDESLTFWVEKEEV